MKEYVDLRSVEVEGFTQRPVYRRADCGPCGGDVILVCCVNAVTCRCVCEREILDVKHEQNMTTKQTKANGKHAHGLRKRLAACAGESGDQ